MTYLGDTYYKQFYIEQEVQERGQSTFLVKRIKTDKIVGEYPFYSFPACVHFIEELVQRTKKIQSIKHRRKWKRQNL
jgi:hypothetical protein